MGSVELMSRLLSVFEPEIGRELVRLDDAIKSGDNPRIANVAHTLKGSAANLSAARLSALASDVEYAARRNESHNHAGLLVELRREFDRCLAALPAVHCRVTQQTTS